VRPLCVTWSMVITTLVLGAIGIVVYLAVKGRIEAPIGDRFGSSTARAPSTAGPAAPDGGTSRVDYAPDGNI
jgi:hypothetical protein